MIFMKYDDMVYDLDGKDVSYWVNNDWERWDNLI